METDRERAAPQGDGPSFSHVLLTADCWLLTADR